MNTNVEGKESMEKKSKREREMLVGSPQADRMLKTKHIGHKNASE